MQKITGITLVRVDDCRANITIDDAMREVAIARSLLKTGPADPIIVVEEKDHWKVLDGSKRLMVYRLFGWQWIAAHVFQDSDRAEQAVFHLNALSLVTGIRRQVDEQFSLEGLDLVTLPFDGDKFPHLARGIGWEKVNGTWRKKR